MWYKKHLSLADFLPRFSSTGELAQMARFARERYWRRYPVSPVFFRCKKKVYFFLQLGERVLIGASFEYGRMRCSHRRLQLDSA